MSRASLATAAAALLLCAAACADGRHTGRQIFQRKRSIENSVADLSEGCLYESRWYRPGAPVATRDACLRCRCARAALACTRRACAPPPLQPPPRCHIRHRKGACCPELHCPDGVTVLEQSASARLDDDAADIAPTASVGQACVEGGVVYAAGSALSARAACEACFCLGGSRRCVRPRCLPPPPGCRAAPAPPACCPDRYYCRRQPAQQAATTTPTSPHPHDCLVDGTWVSEGERIPGGNCSSCFCLGGGQRCQPLSCAPPLLGCEPVLRPGECCPHHYRCQHSQHKQTQTEHDDVFNYELSLDNSLIPTRNDDRSFHSTRQIEKTTAKSLALKTSITNDVSHEPGTKKISESTPIFTTKVKRKTSDAPPITTTNKPSTAFIKITQSIQKRTTEETPTQQTTPQVTAAPEIGSTEQPDRSVKVVINGTINCTAELSTGAPGMNTSDEEHPTVSPLTSPAQEKHIADVDDFITDRIITSEFDENESFVVNVTSSLSHQRPLAPAHTSTPPAQLTTITKKTKGDYDYDYTEPTLPPSLPNLKIIPFVAADAVVEDDAPVKEAPYPITSIDRDDKHPVYYPSQEQPQTLFANRREDVYHPTQYPVFVSNKAAKYPSSPHEAGQVTGMDLSSTIKEFTVSASLGSQSLHKNKATKPPATASTFKLEKPANNMFSPPVETEGGFIPKGPGLIDEYYAVYPSTHSPSSLPHLTTSMQLDTGKGDCVTSDGRLVSAGASMSVGCSECACAWGSLRCSPRPCSAPPPPCRRLPSPFDPCCGDLVCEPENKTTAPPVTTEKMTHPTTHKVISTSEENAIPVTLVSDLLPFDPPPDRSVPPTDPFDPPPDRREPHPNPFDPPPDRSEPPSDPTPMPANIHTVPNNHKTYTLVTRVSDHGTTNLTSVATLIHDSDDFDTVTSKNQSTVKEVPKNITDTTIPPHVSVMSTERPPSNVTQDQTHDYEEDEDDDDGFSLGSVLKLLLSDSYGTTTPAPRKPPPPTTRPPPPPTTTTTTPSTTRAPDLTTRRAPVKPGSSSFIPLPHQPYLPPKKVPHNTVNRIDHLVLGEATAIKMTTPRPHRTPAPAFKPFPPRTTTRKPLPTRPAVTKKQPEQYSPPPDLRPSTAGVPGGVGSLLKLAGCNIYGRMYRVGRIITELSTPCQECRCTELGVQCAPLPC